MVQYPGYATRQNIRSRIHGSNRRNRTRSARIQVGDRVVIPFNVNCGHCWFCRNNYWSQCDRVNSKANMGAAFGYTQLLGGYDGGQAEYVRIPFANAEASLKVPNSIKNDEQVLFLSDILPTGYFGADIADVQPGDDVAVFGAGPVG